MYVFKQSSCAAENVNTPSIHKIYIYITGITEYCKNNKNSYQAYDLIEIGMSNERTTFAHTSEYSLEYVQVITLKLLHNSNTLGSTTGVV